MSFPIHHLAGDANKMSNRVKKTTPQSKAKLAERDDLLRAIFRSAVVMKSSCSSCKTRGLVCKSAPSVSSACFECVRRHEPYCDAQGVTAQQLQRIADPAQQVGGRDGRGGGGARRPGRKNQPPSYSEESVVRENEARHFSWYRHRGGVGAGGAGGSGSTRHPGGLGRSATHFDYPAFAGCRFRAALGFCVSRRPVGASPDVRLRASCRFTVFRGRSFSLAGLGSSVELLKLLRAVEVRSRLP